jgi:hypothetical protein
MECKALDIRNFLLVHHCPCSVSVLTESGQGSVSRLFGESLSGSISRFLMTKNVYKKIMGEKTSNNFFLSKHAIFYSFTSMKGFYATREASNPQRSHP